MQPRYVVVLGGGYSGLGKGLVAASIGSILNNLGFSISMKKIDPYFNFGAGDQNPNEHGEVFVTQDGGEIDQDFGHYERLTGIPMSASSNITSAKLFSSVLEKSKKGEYLGKTVQLIPHVRDEVKRLIKMDNSSDFKIIEVGGTIGDDESLIFLRALQSMKYEDNENMIFVLLAPVIFNEAVGEPKTKIIQNSCKQLLEMGIKPDFVVARVDDARRLDDKRKRKIATFCFVNEENIIVDPDISNIYEMPLIFSNQSFGQKILSYFNITRGHETLAQHSELIKSYQTSKNGPTVKIGYVGKYVTEGGMVHKDAYISVDESIRRACAEAGVNPEVVRINSEDIERDGTGVLESVDGIIVPGGYGSRGLDGKIQAVQFARENKIPFLGLCLGMQMAVIEFARNVCGMTSAHSDEMHDAGEKCNDDHIITILPDQEKIRKNEGFIGTQRLGDYVCYLNDDTIKDMYTLVGRPDENEKARIEIFKQEKSVRLGVSQDSMYPIIERHRHRREVNPKVIEKLKSNGMNFPGIHISLNGEILAEIISLKDHPFFYASQFHPEFTTNYMRPNPLFYGFVKTIGDKKRIVDEIKTKA